MARLFGTDLKYIAAGGTLGSAMKLTKEGVAVKVCPHIIDRKSTRLNSSHIPLSRMPSSA